VPTFPLGSSIKKNQRLHSQVKLFQIFYYKKLGFVILCVSSFFISKFGTGENCSKKGNLIDILLWDEIENWEPF
jgi:hypothetical protein